MGHSLEKRFSLTRRATSSAMVASIAIHALLFFIGLSIILFKVTDKQEEDWGFQLVEPPSTSGRQVILDMPDDMLRADLSAQIKQPDDIAYRELNPSDAGLSDVSKWQSQGLGSGEEDIISQEIDFFGIVDGGAHVVFILDYSLSMSGEKDGVMRREAARIIRSLSSGTQFAVICFSGPAWQVGEDPNPAQWVHTRSSWHSIRPKDWNNLPPIKYAKSTPSVRQSVIWDIQATPLAYGTVYDAPIYMALSMDPVPDAIFFMTDGECPEHRGIESLKMMVDQLLESGKDVPVMHTVGFGISENEQLQKMAELMNGECRFLTAEDYMTRYGKESSISSRRPRRRPKKGTMESAPEDQYPVEFTLR